MKWLAILAVSVFFFLSLSSARATHVNCGQNINSSTVLDSDLNCTSQGSMDTALIIGADNITLDCNGYAIRGGNLGLGITLSYRQNVAIKNCLIQSFLLGLSLQYSNLNTFQDITVNGDTVLFDNYYGVYLYTSSFNTFSSITANKTHQGLTLATSSNNNTFSSITANNNFNGLNIYGSFYNTFSSITANNNGNGIAVTGGSQNNKFSSVIANKNGVGLYINSVHNNTLQNITANSNSAHGLWLIASNYNTFSSITANNNSQSGLFLYGNSHNNTLQNITANNNTKGISFYFFPYFNTLQSITANNNQYGIHVDYYSVNNTISSSTFISNNIGVYATQFSNSNTIFNNYFNNTINAFNNAGLNYWNITKTPGTNIIGGPFLGGNFWHDYAGQDLDGDGLGDTLLPYNSSGNIVNGGDFLPLTMPNHPPTITSTPNTTAIFGQIYTYDMEAADPDNDPLAYSLLVFPTNMTINASTGLIQWKAKFNYTMGPPTNGTAGNFTFTTRRRFIFQPVPVTAQVSDGFGGIATQEWNITIQL